MYRDTTTPGSRGAADRHRGGSATGRGLGRRQNGARRAGDGRAVPSTRAANVTAWPLTRRGWCFLALAVVALLAAQVLGRRDLLSVGIFLALLPTAGLLHLRWSRPALTARRRLDPAQAEVGRPVRVHLAVDGTVHGGRALAQEDVDPALGSPLGFRVPDPGQTPGVDGDGDGDGDGAQRRGTVRGRYRYELHPTRRGVYAVGPLRLRRQDPFGMTVRHVLTGDPDTVVVRPRLVDLRGGPDEGWRDVRGMSPAVRTTARTEVDVSTREYRPGDPLRRVHWPASARHGSLMVRQELSTTTPPAVLLVDDRIGAHLSRTGAAFAPGPGSGNLVTSDGFELVVSLGLSVAAELSRAGADVLVRSADGRPLLHTSTTAVDPRQDSFSRAAGIADLATGLAGLSLRAAAHEGQEPGRAGHRSRGSRSRHRTGTDDPIVAGTTAAGPVFDPAGLRDLPRDTADGDLFVLAGELTDAETTRLAALAGTVAAAYVVLVVPRPDAAVRTLDRLRDAGWTAVAVGRHETVRSVWDAWTRERAARPRHAVPATPVPGSTPGVTTTSTTGRGSTR
ncbi:hypothetical protein BKD30_10705 [Tersicoccus phoenicis]|uniref:DUF58 domain-containing protein n=1 Tax=Tersicoccus phoenicis TaxID=554083 RepID=A0A1R1L8H2_9MICC|nr:DUF58 domain-containing protein [Tersicoccus phoenicis]OMH23836.1 hypothetical protein BKD30_10705 [Tersicoccus phoenicis]